MTSWPKIGEIRASFLGHSLGWVCSQPGKFQSKFQSPKIVKKGQFSLSLSFGLVFLLTRVSAASMSLGAKSAAFYCLGRYRLPKRPNPYTAADFAPKHIDAALTLVRRKTRPKEQWLKLSHFNSHVDGVEARGPEFAQPIPPIGRVHSKVV